MTYCDICKYPNSENCNNCIIEYDDWDINYEHYIPHNATKEQEKEIKNEWRNYT